MSKDRSDEHCLLIGRVSDSDFDHEAFYRCKMGLPPRKNDYEAHHQPEEAASPFQEAREQIRRRVAAHRVEIDAAKTEFHKTLRGVGRMKNCPLCAEPFAAGTGVRRYILSGQSKPSLGTALARVARSNNWLAFFATREYFRLNWVCDACAAELDQQARKQFRRKMTVVVVVILVIGIGIMAVIIEQEQKRVMGFPQTNSKLSH